MHTSTLLLAGFVTFCSAQSTTTLFLPGFDLQAILASVAGSDATATTYALACPSNIKLEDCGIPPSFTLTQGPATAIYAYSLEGSYESIGCSLGSTTTAVCVVTATPVETGPSVTTTGISGTLLASQFQAVTVTDSLPGQPAAETGSQGILSTGSLPSSIPGDVSTTSGLAIVPTAAGTGASSATAATKTSTAGMTQITGNVGWAVGGAALALAVAGL